MAQNSPIVEFETAGSVSFRVILRSWSNDTNPSHPAVLERYDGSEWQEVDIWDAQNHRNNSNTVKIKDYEKITEEAKSKINYKPMFNKDGEVSQVNRRY